MYLEDKIPNAKVLITVKTYPSPTPTQKEVVCTAGLLNGKKWVRIYPINFRDKPYSQQFSKYSWIKLNLIKNPNDYRLESYQPEKHFDEDIQIVGHVGTENRWEERRKIITSGEVIISMTHAITLAKEQNRSLVTLKPKDIIDFVIEPTERDWSETQQEILRQESLFDFSGGRPREIIKKLPYKYSYKFLTEGDSNPRKLMITDWEIGALYWNLIRKYDDEDTVNKKIREKYFDKFCNDCELLFFLGTTYRYHRTAKNPFIIIGVFYPPKTFQQTLF
ncbi:hypothetical protein KQH50_01165 [bacterium]|nr:hypothetical protein [bacterium]